MGIKIAKFTTEIADENGEPLIQEFEMEYDTEVTEDIVIIEFVSNGEGGPLLRPRKPHI